MKFKDAETQSARFARQLGNKKCKLEVIFFWILAVQVYDL